MDKEWCGICGFPWDKHDKDTKSDHLKELNTEKGELNG